jgi:hypothetical protein
MAKAKRTKPYWEMNLRELREATREFDKPIDPSRSRPLTPTQRARWERAQRGPAYSIFIPRGKKKKLSVKVDEWLLERCDSYAKRHEMTLDEVIERSLAASLTFAGRG